MQNDPMILCLDVGNTHVYGGVFTGDKIRLRFRYTTSSGTTSDQLGIFLKSVLRENGLDCSLIHKIAICSVVPFLDYSIRSACIKYFDLEPFILQAGVKTGLQIKYRNPLEVGADRIANAIAATTLYPEKDLILVDFGTATTYCGVTADKQYIGGVIQAGMRLSIDALEQNTAKLSSVEIVRPEAILGRSTAESIQSGLYFGQMAATKHIIKQLKQECFTRADPLVIGTGGFAHLFEHEELFNSIEPDLVLHGLRLALEMN